MTHRFPCPAKLSRALRREDGQALVEFALVLPVLLLILIGILYFGRYLNYASDETQLASTAARWATVNVNPGSGSLQSYVASQAVPELKGGSSDVSAVQVYIYYPSGSSGQPGSSVRACVSSNVNLPSLLGIGVSTRVTETTTMRLEQTATNWTPDASVPAWCPTN